MDKNDFKQGSKGDDMEMHHERKANTIKGRYLIAAAGAAAIMMSSPSLSRAANIVWSGTVSSDFEDGNNWVGGNAPANDAATDFAVFDAAATYQPSLTKNRSVGGLTFKSSGWTLGGSSYTLTKGSAVGYAIEMKAPGTVTLDPNTVVSGYNSNSINWLRSS